MKISNSLFDQSKLDYLYQKCIPWLLSFIWADTLGHCVSLAFMTSYLYMHLHSPIKCMSACYCTSHRNVKMQNKYAHSCEPKQTYEVLDILKLLGRVDHNAKLVDKLIKM